MAVPVGSGVSLWVRVRTHGHVGQADRRSSIQWGLHWLGFLAAGMLRSILVVVGHLDWPGFGSLVVLLLSLTYLHFGLQIERRLLPISAVGAVCYLVTVLVSAYEWTLAGVLLATALILQARLGARTHDVAH